MRKTEQDLWHEMRKYDPAKFFTRIETAATAAGVSDTTYKTTQRHGWLELKTCNTLARSHRWVPDHEFSIAQLSWIAKHNVPTWRMFSYVLLGRYDCDARWTAFALVPPGPAIKLLNGAKDAAPQRTWHVFDEMEGVVDHLNTYAKGR